MSNFSKIKEDGIKEAIDEKFVIKELTEEGVLIISMNRPKRSNGLTSGMYLLIAQYLNEASASDQVKVVVFRGNGKNFCSGNDLSNFSKVESTDTELIKKSARFSAYEVLKPFTEAFLDCKKPIIALVQGASIGVGFTLLGLCDLVYASENTIFQAPLVKLAQGAEMCSSYTFPHIFGKQRAFEIINLGQIFKLKELNTQGFVNKVFSTPEELLTQGLSIAKQIAQLDDLSLLESKKLLNQHESATLRQVMIQELDNLAIRWSLIDRIMPAILSHLSNKPKL